MTAIIFDSRRIVKPASFGRGVLPACKPATDAEWAAHRERTTFSAAEWAGLRAEAEAASLDRYARLSDADQAEAAELGISPEAMERLATESAELDRVCSIPSPAALAAAEVAEVRTVQVRGKRYVAALIAAEDDEVLAAVRLTGPAGQVYDVARTVHGFACTCPDFIWKREGTGTNCKHVVACHAAGLLDPPAPAPRPARKPRPQTLRQRNQAARRAARAALA